MKISHEIAYICCQTQGQLTHTVKNYFPPMTVHRFQEYLRFQGLGGSFPSNFQGFFIWGRIPPALFYSEVAFGVLLNTVFDLMNIINNCSNYHGVSEKKVKLITSIDHKSDLGRNAPPQNLAFFKCGWEFQVFGGEFPPLNTPAIWS